MVGKLNLGKNILIKFPQGTRRRWTDLGWEKKIFSFIFFFFFSFFIYETKSKLLVRLWVHSIILGRQSYL